MLAAHRHHGDRAVRPEHIWKDEGRRWVQHVHRSCALNRQLYQSPHKLHRHILLELNRAEKHDGYWHGAHVLVSIWHRRLLPATEFPIDVEILIMADYKWKHKCDADNIIKPLVDLLVRAEIVLLSYLRIQYLLRLRLFNHSSKKESGPMESK